jgi:hypothetical protein
MKRSFLILLMLIPCLWVQAQLQSKYAVFTTGGSYGATGNRVSSYYYDISTGNQVKFDSALGDFSNAIIIDQQYVYSHIGRGSVHAMGGDVITKYNLLTQLRIDSAPNIPGLNRMKVHKNYLITTRAFGADSNFVQIYSTSSLSVGPVYRDTMIKVFTEGIAVLRDTLYVSYTESDTAKIGIISLTGTLPEYVRSITLDTLAAGIAQLYTDGTFIYGLCERVNYPPPTFNPVIVSAGVVKLNPLSGNYVFTATPRARNGVGLYNGLLYANYSTGPGAFDINSNVLIANPALPLDYAGGIMDTNLLEGYFMTTDYFSFGKMYKTDQTGFLLDSFSTEISGGPIDILYNGMPIAINGTGYTAIDVPYSYNLALIAGDTDGGIVTFTITTPPSNGIAGITGNILTYTPNTGYTGIDSVDYTATDIWGASATARYYIHVGATQNEQTELAAKLNVYPNPASDFITISYENSNEHMVTISDVHGRHMYTEKVSGTSTLPLHRLHSGVYIMHDEQGKTARIIVR